MQQSLSPSIEFTNEEWEDFCMKCGCWEWIDGELSGNLESKGESRQEKNEFGGKSGVSILHINAANWCI